LVENRPFNVTSERNRWGAPVFKASVNRRQYPVGHGGFHAGCIQLIEPQRSGDPIPDGREFHRFWYVYDCGSEQSAAFKSALASYRSVCDGRTDILFVSHLHSDHINGIERLQAQAPAATVVVPYLDIVERLLFILSDIASGSASSSAREYFADPAGWWRARGATRIIFIEPGDGDDESPGPPGVPDEPVPGGEPPDGAEEISREQKEPGGRLAAHLRMPAGGVPAGLKVPDVNKHEISEGAYLAGSGSSLQLEWRPNIRDAWRIGDWILLPYVHPADTKTRTQFRRAVARVLNVRSRDEAKLTQKLLEHLSSYAKTKVLLNLYSDYFEHGHNALSMSLYSGPFCRNIGDPRNEDHRQRTWRMSFGHWRYESFLWEPPVGWLGTGDAALKQSTRREPWLKFFRPFASDVLVMTLPHHGSAHNFHEDILAFDGMRVALATTVERRQRVSRVRETLDFVEAREIAAWIVDDNQRSGFSVCCERSMGW
jgi:hypothetical protein